ncbi:unnamed protein product [Discosporangium mesarthrocarpum]
MRLPNSWLLHTLHTSAHLGKASLSRMYSGVSTSRGHPGRIFCDLDGVLCDFDRGVVNIFGVPPEELSKKTMWGGLSRAPGFYSNLEWMNDGRELWEGIRGLQPTILTGVPMGKWAEPQKRAWCSDELGGDVPVITCMSRDKHKYCHSPGCILIDDRGSLRVDWESQGGLFIHHTSTRQSLKELEAILSPKPATVDLT